MVGQVAARSAVLRKPEPYKGKGIKYQGDRVRRKAGKAGGKYMAKIGRRPRRERRTRRHLRVRKKVNGTVERPRLVVFRSLKHIYAQLVDDNRGAPR